MRLGWRTVHVLGTEGDQVATSRRTPHRHDGCDERRGLCRGAGRWAGPASGQSTETPAKLSIIGADAIDVRLRPDAADDSVDRGTLSVAIANTGDQPTTLEPTAFLGNRAHGRICTVDRVDTKLDAASLEPHSVTEISLRLSLRKGCVGQRRHGRARRRRGGRPRHGRLRPLASTARHRSVEAVPGRVRARRWRPKRCCSHICSRRGPKRLGWFTAEVAVGPTWSFKDSWLTNVAAVGALLGTILGAGDFLKDLIPGTSTVRLDHGEHHAGGMVTLARRVRRIQQVEVDGRRARQHETRHGQDGSEYVAAAGATVGGVFLELATIGYIADLSDASRGVKGFVSRAPGDRSAGGGAVRDLVHRRRRERSARDPRRGRRTDLHAGEDRERRALNELDRCDSRRCVSGTVSCGGRRARAGPCRPGCHRAGRAHARRRCCAGSRWYRLRSTWRVDHTTTMCGCNAIFSSSPWSVAS